MAKQDVLVRFIFDNLPVRGEYVHLDETFQTIVQQHAYPEPISRLLGEALAAAGLLSASIKFTGRLTVQFQGKGKLKLLLAQCDNELKMRGLVKWDGELSYEELMQSFNDGVLVIMLDANNQKNRYQGVVAWRGNSLAESIEGYFKDSEQLSTKIWLNVDSTTAAGLMLQAMPEVSEAPIFESEIIDSHWSRIIGLAEQIPTHDLLNLSYAELLTQTYPDENVRVFPEAGTMFHCACTRKRGEDAIYILGKEEAELELKEKQSIVVTCDFCNREYEFDRVDVAEIFAGRQAPPADTHLH